MEAWENSNSEVHFFQSNDSAECDWDLLNWATEESVLFEATSATVSDVSVGKAPTKRKQTKSVVTKSARKRISAHPTRSTTEVKPSEDFVLKIVGFPAFDKSDALLYLPSTFARLLNSGDMTGLGKLMRNYCQKECSVMICPGITLGVQSYVDLLRQKDIVQADSLMCMHSTKVIGNQIHAVLYHKHTDVPEMYNYIDTMSIKPELRFFFVGRRVEILQRNLRLRDCSATTREEIVSILQLGEKLQVYGKLDLIITFDPYTKKFVDVHHSFYYTSIVHNGVEYTLDLGCHDSLR